MKQFNINDDIYIHITDMGWKYLTMKHGCGYVEKYIKPYSKVINDKIYHKMQCHEVFNILPTSENSKGVLFEPVIFIDESHSLY